MTEGALLGPAAIAQLQKLMREHTRRMRNAESQRRQYGGVRDSRRIAVLQSDLLAAVDWMRDPSTALAKLARKKSGTSDYILTDEEVIVVNRFENISLDSGTVLGIEWIDGEWQPYKADCSPESGSMSIYSAGGFESAQASDFFIPDLGGPGVGGP
jgi:hypothetical protein